MITALTVSGSDSSGGAGLQADLRAFAAHDVHGVCALTAVTAQSTTEVSRIHVVPADVVTAQIRSVASSHWIAAAKTGMLANAQIVEAVVASLRDLDLAVLVVDPVLVSSSGTSLLEAQAIDSLLHDLLPLASCVTPNRHEAERLAHLKISSVADAREAARRIGESGPAAVVVTGGHLPTDEVVDVVFDGTGFVELRGPRVHSATDHGTGCTFSATLTAALAKGHALVDAARVAQRQVHDALSALP